MNHQQRRDFLTLRDALATDRMIAKHWDFAHLRNAIFKAKGPYACGSTGCALGWMPTLFRELSYNPYGYLFHEDGPDEGTSAEKVAAAFFGITDAEGNAIFVHGYDDACAPPVTPLDVAQRMDKVLAVHDEIRRKEREAAEATSTEA